MQSFPLTSNRAFLVSQAKHLRSFNDDDDGGDCNGLFFCRKKHFVYNCENCISNTFYRLLTYFCGLGRGLFVLETNSELTVSLFDPLTPLLPRYI